MCMLIIEMLPDLAEEISSEIMSIKSKNQQAFDVRFQILSDNNFRQYLKI